MGDIFRWLGAWMFYLPPEALCGQKRPQDYPSAHLWYNLASANGHEEAGEMRDNLADEMTPDQIAEAQARARVCMASDYQDCD